MSAGNVICCVRVGDTKAVPYGVTKTKCADCSHDIWIAPSSVDLLRADPALKVVCQFCVMKRIETDPDVLFAMTPAAVKEARAFTKRVQNN